MCRVDEKSVIFVTISFLVKDVENAFSLVIVKKIVVVGFSMITIQITFFIL